MTLACWRLALRSRPLSHQFKRYQLRPCDRLIRPARHFSYTIRRLDDEADKPPPRDPRLGKLLYEEDGIKVWEPAEDFDFTPKTNEEIQRALLAWQNSVNLDDEQLARFVKTYPGIDQKTIEAVLDGQMEESEIPATLKAMYPKGLPQKNREALEAMEDDPIDNEAYEKALKKLQQSPDKEMMVAFFEDVASKPEFEQRFLNELPPGQRKHWQKLLRQEGARETILEELGEVITGKKRAAVPIAEDHEAELADDGLAPEDQQIAAELDAEMKTMVDEIDSDPELLELERQMKESKAEIDAELAKLSAEDVGKFGKTFEMTPEEMQALEADLESARQSADERSEPLADQTGQEDMLAKVKSEIESGKPFSESIGPLIAEMESMPEAKDDPNFQQLKSLYDNMNAMPTQAEVEEVTSKLDTDPDIVARLAKTDVRFQNMQNMYNGWEKEIKNNPRLMQQLEELPDLPDIDQLLAAIETDPAALDKAYEQHEAFQKASAENKQLAPLMKSTSSVQILQKNLASMSEKDFDLDRVTADRMREDDKDDEELNTDAEKWEGDDLTSQGHMELAQHREIRQYARWSAWELPLLSKLARPFEQPTAAQALRFRYTTYMGEDHPAASKVVVEFSPKHLPLTAEQQLKLIKIVGPRYNPDKDLVRMSAESFETQAQNKRYLGDLVGKLVAEAKDPSDMFDDLQVDLRHAQKKRRKYVAFPEEWKMTEEKRAQLEEKRRLEAEKADDDTARLGQVDGMKVIEDGLSSRTVDQPVLLPAGRSGARMRR